MYLQMRFSSLYLIRLRGLVAATNVNTDMLSSLFLQTTISSFCSEGRSFNLHAVSLWIILQHCWFGCIGIYSIQISVVNVSRAPVMFAYNFVTSSCDEL